MARSEEMAAIIGELELKIRAAQGVTWEEIQYALSRITIEEDKGLHGLACYYAAFYLMHAGKQEECLCYLNESIRCMVGTEQECHMARCYNILGLVFQSHNNLIGAMEQYARTLAYAKEYGQLFYQALAECNMADSYYRVEKYDCAVSCYRDCVRDFRKTGLHAGNGKHAYRKILAAYGFCLMMEGSTEEADAVKKEIENSIRENAGPERENLSVDVFFILWYHRKGEVQKREDYLNRAIEVIAKGCTIVMEYDRIMNLIQMLIMMKRFESLQLILNYLEPQALMENNEGFLLQLRLFRMQYCSKDMDAESFKENMHNFFSLKAEFENTENCQIPRLLSLRDRLSEIEREHTQLKKENSKLLYRTEHDELSGLYNKRTLNNHLEEMFEEAFRKKLPLSVLFVDIDYFKQLNDRYGHRKGDECIVEIAETIKECVPGGFATRYGGDEFVVLLLNQSRESVARQAQAIVDRIGDMHIENADAGGEKVVTVTVGIAHAIPQKNNKAWDFLACADSALYEQKNEQKGRVRFHTGQGKKL